MSTHSDGVARERAPGRRDKRPDPGRVLDAGRALDAGGDIDAAGAAQRDRGLDRVGVQAPGQKPGNGGSESPASGSSRTDGRCRPAAPRPLAAWRRSADSRRRPRRPPRHARSPRVATPIAFIVGRAKSSPISFTRAGVSLPCNCMRSGDKASTMRFSVSSSASTLSATIFARPSGLAPESARGRPVDVARAFGEKHEPDHVRAGVERGVERQGRGKAADFDRGRHRALLSVKAPALSKGRGWAAHWAGGSFSSTLPAPRLRSSSSISPCAAARILASASR